MSSLFVNKKTTYITIMENEFFFKEIMDYMARNEELKNTNKVPKTIYEEILKSYVEKKYEKEFVQDVLGQKVLLALSPENLIQNELMAVASGVLYGGDLLLLANHLVQMLKNVFKEYAQALSKVEYDDLAMLLREKRRYLENRPSLSGKSADVKEMIISLEMVLIRAEESIISSIGALNYRKQNIALSSGDGAKASKYRVAKELYEKFINPLYHFVSPKNSAFMEELSLISEFLAEKSELYYLKRKIDFYAKQFLLHSKEIQPIRQYIAGYIRQTEVELEINLGSEKLYNELITIVDKYKVGSRNVKYELYRGVEELNKIDNPFKRSLSSSSSKNIKTFKNSAESFAKIELYLMEIMGKQKERKVLKKQNRDVSIEIIKKREADRRKRLAYVDMVYDCKRSVEVELAKKKKLMLTDLVKRYVLSKDVLGIGEFEYIIMSIIKESPKKYIFNVGEDEKLEVHGSWAKFKKIEIRRK